MRYYRYNYLLNQSKPGVYLEIFQEHFLPLVSTWQRNTSILLLDHWMFVRSLVFYSAF